MSSFLARVGTQQQLRYVPHTSVSGETWQLVKPGTCTGNGAAGGTTLVDTGGDSGAARTYNGQYYVEILSGANQGRWKRIVEDDGAGTLTLENNGFDSQIVTGVEYKIWKSPEPVCTVTTSTSTTEFTCSARTEADDTWIGYEAIVIYASDNGGTSPVRGEIQTISDSTSAGVITVDTAFSNQPRVGDVLLIGKFVEFSSPSAGLENAIIPRPGNRVNFGRGDGVVGPRGGTFGFNTQIRPSGTTVTAGTAAPKSECSGLFQAVGLVENQDTTTAIDGAGSTTTSLDITTGNWESFTIGNMVIVNGEATFITAMTDGAGAADNLTVAPPLSLAPGAGDLVHATVGYHKSVNADVYGVCLELEQDGLRHTMTGCKGSVQLVDGGAPEFNWTFNVDHYIREIEAAPYNAVSAYTTAPQVQAKDRIAYLDASAGTKVDIEAFTATPGTVVVPKPVQGSAGINGRSGFQLTNFEARATWSEILDASSATLPQETRWTARTSKAIAVVLGSHGSTFACRVPVARQIEAPHPTEADGLLKAPVVWEAQDAGLQAGTDPVTDQKIPDFAFFIS